MSKLLKRIFSILLILAVLLLIVGRKAGWFERTDENKTAKSASGPEVLPVNAVVLASGGLSDLIYATGTILADEQVDLSAEVSGRITSIRFTEGSFVKKGDLLVTINDAELLAQQRKNNYTLRLAEEREARQKSLLAKEAVSQEVYDRALTELNTVQAEAALIEAQLQKTRVVAPFDGTIGLRQVSEGAYITPGQRIASLARTIPVKLEFTVPERFSGSVSKGAKVKFSVESIDRQLEAEVYATEPRIDPVTRALTVRATYPNTRGELNPGAYARVEFKLNHLSEAITVPAQAIVPELGGFKVFVYRGGKAETRDISVGIRTNEAVQVVDGLSVGDTVITTGILQVRNGMPVNIDNLTVRNP
ncbi:MAG: efflux RND transporter periplasmic adaptor subunit [Lentimicrobium sp.]|uniref:efflux RND transporter periplasmic adaptor subunit n=1 Tax=Lentimicrobium sp. TaxID=2034841 RepID=UPI0025D4057A|nr:efflux RND transporter periplasmic adaptor subunit [Lentimicrobium sp.]MCO5256501.1 efflux RND transporter periplasmic adaptor subunit [Lentimicrobium sp.]MCO5262991.1 efflux RND transporter periplasmic adaptor subunit [Lentimicrobium sp.]